MTQKYELVRTTLILPRSLKDAVEKHCEKRGITIADLYRRAIAKEIGRSELAQQVNPEGRPRKSRDD